MMIQNKTIAIIGGGPGGLSLARLLQMAGAEVTVYERDQNSDVRIQGATLDLHEDSGLKTIRKAGLMEAFLAHFRPGADKMRVVDRAAHIHFDDHRTKPAEDFGDADFRPEIDRGPLRKILLAALQPGTVVWDRQFISMTQTDQVWTIQFQNGETATADLVIGADGARSRIRPYLTDIKPFYSGITMVEGTIYDAAINSPRIYELLKGGKIFALGDSKTLIVSSKEAGAMSFYTGCKTAESWVVDSGIDFKDNTQLLHWFQQEFSGWDPIWQELFAHEKTSFIPRPQYCMPLTQTWTAQANLSLIGDAAHLMPPFAGEGVNMAMLDALELSECLRGNQFSDLQSAIAHYELKMRERAAATAKMTLEQTESLHSEKALDNMLRMFSEEPS
ncbi:2-polyprenyl-6-methoxyphenol hydroxylase [Taibaiella sp. KBW10]|uniref:FAD-dependent oxidoreductase n=1 Tax=Taibaiella sp. KBW10 TaxID=2153357 RepID=UPI000F5A6BC8|nr:NAD(P)/FAD-dependent oxidoreductase [Taibaiella sp. KBW10]RQO30941.1 2-polyprenyl-6-methoxyphenol hydroxylase [Taibaiella sp. KBW10]